MVAARTASLNSDEVADPLWSLSTNWKTTSISSVVIGSRRMRRHTSVNSSILILPEPFASASLTICSAVTERESR